MAEPQVTSHLGRKAEGHPQVVAALSEAGPCPSHRRVRDTEHGFGQVPKARPLDKASGESAEVLEKNSLTFTF